MNALGPIPVKGLASRSRCVELVGAVAVRTRYRRQPRGGSRPWWGGSMSWRRWPGAGARRTWPGRSWPGRRAGGGQVPPRLGVHPLAPHPGLAGAGERRYVLRESHAVLPGRRSAQALCPFEDADDPRAIRAKVTGKVLTLDEALHGTIPALLALLDTLPEESPCLALDPSQRRQRTLDACKRLLLRESQVQPLLLVFEDLHWIDSETQALLDSLVESLPAARLLLLVNYRPEYQHGWGSKTYYAQLRLDPLPPTSAEELLKTLLGDDLSLVPLKGLLIERTEGNPFFLEESVRALVETGVLVGERGAYRLAKPLESMQVPATVQAVLAGRIDRLPPEEKRLLQTAAVIGTEVPFPLLQAIAELSEAEVHRGLAHLQAAEFLYETSLFPELAYTFKHALTHEVAYGSLLQERRRALHNWIVELLEQLAPERLAEQVERLAYHALRGEAWDKAISYYRQAGAKAMARSAYREALTCFEQALAALQHLPESRDTVEQTIDLRLDLRTALHPLGESGRVLDHLRAAEALAEGLGDHQRLAQVTGHLLTSFDLVGDYAQVVEDGQRTLAMAIAHGDVALQVRALSPWAGPTTPWATIGRRSHSSATMWQRSQASSSMRP